MKPYEIRGKQNQEYFISLSVVRCLLDDQVHGDIFPMKIIKHYY